MANQTKTKIKYEKKISSIKEKYKKKSNIKKKQVLKKKNQTSKVFTSPGPFPINLFLDAFQ